MGGASMTAATLATEWLSGCAGCHVALVDLHEKLLGLVDELRIVRLPLLMDERDYPEADIGLVEGAIRSEHDRHAAERMRASCRLLVALGTCATYGGSSGLGWLHAPADILAAAYGREPTHGTGEPPGAELPPLEPSVVPLDEVVDVDLYLPGCPPHASFVAAALRKLLDGDRPALGAGTVCSECTRTMKRCQGVELRPGATVAPDAATCFLSQGVVCLGSVSLNRCLAPCPTAGVACTGCTGPSIDVLTQPHLDLRTLVASRMAQLTGIDRAHITEHMERHAATFYAHCLSSPAIYQKPAVNLREWTSSNEPA